MQRHAFDGKPYFCTTCGAGFETYRSMKCFTLQCRLEIEDAAAERKTVVDAVRSRSKQKEVDYVD